MGKVLSSCFLFLYYCTLLLISLLVSTVATLEFTSLFFRLAERFVAPNHFGGPCPPPSFPGYQEFFKMFVVIAASHPFNQHLIDGLSAQIQEVGRCQVSFFLMTRYICIS